MVPTTYTRAVQVRAAVSRTSRSHPRGWQSAERENNKCWQGHRESALCIANGAESVAHTAVHSSVAVDVQACNSNWEAKAGRLNSGLSLAR